MLSLTPLFATWERLKDDIMHTAYKKGGNALIAATLFIQTNQSNRAGSVCHRLPLFSLTLCDFTHASQEAVHFCLEAVRFRLQDIGR